MGYFKLSTFSLGVVLSLVLVCSDSKYAFLETCSRNDPNLDSCILEKAAIVAPRILKGVPEVNLPRLDPLYIDTVTLEIARDLSLTVKDIFVHGLDTYKFLSVKTEFEKQQFIAHFHFDNITLTGEYKLQGKLSFLDLTGNSGPVIASLENIDLNLTIHWDFYEKKEKIYANITKVDFEQDVQKIHVDLKNIFGENERLGKEVNTLLNENWHTLATEFNDVVNQAVGIILGRVNAIAKRIPFDELFPET